MLKCRTCEVVASDDLFDVRVDTGKRRPQCKGCRRKYQRERHLARAQPRTSVSRRADAAELFRCTRCGEIKCVGSFYRRGKTSLHLQSWCIPCLNQHNATRYQLNRPREIARTRENRNRARSLNRQRLREYLSNHPCVDCNNSDTRVLEFDHLRDKRTSVSNMVGLGWSWKTIELEISKCQVRCANCHRIKTYERARIDRGPAKPQDPLETLAGLEPALT